MKALVVFLLVVLSCSLTEGRVFTKCELRDLLKNATANITLKTNRRGPTMDDLLAMIVCHAEKVSGLNTSVVNNKFRQENDDSEENHSRENHSGENHSGENHSGQNHNCTHYGIFQMSSCKVCNDSVTPSDNMCTTACSNFLQDDISNDIICILKTAKDLGVKRENDGKIADKIKTLLVKDCKNVKASTYFVGLLC